MEVTLKEYLDKLLEVLSRSSEREIDARAKSLEGRLESMNEFRAQIQNERIEYVRKDTLKFMEERLSKIENRMSNMDGRFVVVGIVITVGLSIFTTLLSLLLRKFIG